MKTRRQIPAIAALLISTSAIGQAQFFTAGNLAVLQVGSGSGTLTSAGAPVFIDQYTTVGTLVNDLAIPSSGSGELVNSGSAASEGGLDLSANGQYLVLAGYNAAAGTTGVASANSSAIARGIASVDASGNYTLAATTSSFYSGNNIRGGTSDGNGNFWGAGAASSGGTVYLGTGTAAQISSANSVVVKDIGGNLFYSTAKNTTGVYEIAGTPTSGTATPTLLLANSAPSSFAFNTSLTLAYVANTTSGIQKYTFNGTSWSLGYTLDSGTGINGLTVDFSGANPILYATTEDGKKLIEITDTGAAAAANTLATVDGTTEAFRGVDFTPVPEPSTFALIGLGSAVLWRGRRTMLRK